MDKPTAEMDLDDWKAAAMSVPGFSTWMERQLAAARAAEREEIARWHEEQAEKLKSETWTPGYSHATEAGRAAHIASAAAIRQRSEASRG